MQVTTGLVALGAIATLVVSGGTAVEAKSGKTDKKESKKVTVTVKAGDTLSGIARKHKTSYIRLFNANKGIDDPDMIFVNDKVRIPKKGEKLQDRFAKLNERTQAQMLAADQYPQQRAPQAAAPTANTAPAPAASYQARGSSAGNSYAYGWCTWYAKQQRPDLPNNLGNAGSWAANAAAQGIPTGSTPRAGAIAVTAGHVAYVESVSGGMITVSEMGWNYTSGQYNTRTVPASSFYAYIY